MIYFIYYCFIIF